MSVTDMSAAMGDGPDPAPVTGGDPAVLPRGDPAEPFVRGALFAYPIRNAHICETGFKTSQIGIAIFIKLCLLSNIRTAVHICFPYALGI